MKKLISLLFIILAVSSASCRNKDETGDKRLEDAKSKYLMEVILRNGSDDFISLLSIKYGLKAELTRKIIDEFNPQDLSQRILTLSKAKTVEEFERLKENFNSPSVEERINNISAETNVDPAKIASLLIDYKIWYDAKPD